jgi:hypothetical protein
MATQTTKIWISYDLGINGDYQSLYTWLDTHKARECGDSMAILKDYKYSGDLVAYVLKDLKKAVKFRKTDRVYLICTKPIYARFIIGGRKRSPWIGYSIDSDDQNDI